MKEKKKDKKKKMDQVRMSLKDEESNIFLNEMEISQTTSPTAHLRNRYFIGTEVLPERSKIKIEQFGNSPDFPDLIARMSGRGGVDMTLMKLLAKSIRRDIFDDVLYDEYSLTRERLESVLSTKNETDTTLQAMISEYNKNVVEPQQEKINKKSLKNPTEDNQGIKEKQLFDDLRYTYDYVSKRVCSEIYYRLTPKQTRSTEFIVPARVYRVNPLPYANGTPKKETYRQMRFDVQFYNPISKSIEYRKGQTLETLRYKITDAFGVPITEYGVQQIVVSRRKIELHTYEHFLYRGEVWGKLNKTLSPCNLLAYNLVDINQLEFNGYYYMNLLSIFKSKLITNSKVMSGKSTHFTLIKYLQRVMRDNRNYVTSEICNYYNVPLKLLRALINYDM